MTPNLLDELEVVVRLMEAATPGEWLTEYRKTPRGYAQEVFDAAGDTIATMAWHAVPLNETTTTTDREANAHLIAGLVNFLRTHAPALADMAKRMEAAERDAALFAAVEYRAEKAVGGHGVRFELRFDPLVVHNGSLREYLQHAIDATQEGAG